MRVTIGTFNLNNLFSRYNFKGEIVAIEHADTSVNSLLTYEFDAEDTYKVRTYLGRLVSPKDAAGTVHIARRIKAMDVDVLAVQEVEDIDTLRQFNRDQLDGLYSYVALVEGNDPRLIDVGLLSKLPLGGITSWQHAVHHDAPSQPVFGRDLLEVQILNPSRTRTLFTLFNNHLKSNYVSFKDDPVEGARANNALRARQADVVAHIVKTRMRPNSRFVVLGDKNDAPDSPYLWAFTADPQLGLVNALAEPQETRPAKPDTPPPPTAAWTHRYKPSKQPALYELYDQIWLSPALAPRQVGAWIDRRQRHGGDGSDHDPAWIEVRL